MIPAITSFPAPSVIERSYRAKFVVSILFVVLVIGSVGAYGYVQVNDTIERDTNHNLESSASMQADSLAEWADGIESHTKSVAGSNDLAQEEESQLFGYLEEERRYHPNVIALHYFNAETGEIYTSTTPNYRQEGLTVDDIDEPWADTAIRDVLIQDTSVWVSNTSYDHADLDQQVVAFAARESYIGGNPNNVIVAEGTIDARIRRLHQPGLNHSTTIVNYYGETVVGNEEGTGNVAAQRQVRETVRHALDSGTVQIRQDGGFLRAYAPVEGTRWDSPSRDSWVAVTTVPETDAFSVRNAVGLYVLLIVVGAIGTLGLVGFVLGRQTIGPLGRLKRQAELMEQGNLDVNLETGRVDEIGRLFYAFDSMRTSLRRQIEEVETARDEADRMNRHLVQKANEYREVMRRCADGDLTRRMTPKSDNEAMVEIAEAFNAMIAEIEQTTEQLANFATAVATSSQEVTASTEEVRSASVQVTESIQEISDGAERQNESLQSVNQEMSGLSTTTEEIAASSNEVATLAERTATTGLEGREAAQAAIQGMNEIEAESERAVSAIEALEEQVDQIDELAEFISELAEQTNMLALNANIEAARSAESGGEGFGVVANEVKELAADTKEAADDIEGRIEGIKAQTRRTTDEVQRTSEQIVDHRGAVENAAEALENIAEYAGETNDGVQDISAATEEQAASTQEVVAMVDEASVISEETTVEAENVAAAAQEQTSSLTEVSHAVSDLAHQAARLSEALDRFETDANADSRAFEGARDETVADAIGTDTAEAGRDPNVGSGGSTDAGEPAPDPSSDDVIAVGPVEDEDDEDPPSGE